MSNYLCIPLHQQITGYKSMIMNRKWVGKYLHGGFYFERAIDFDYNADSREEKTYTCFCFYLAKLYCGECECFFILSGTFLFVW